MSNTTRFMVPCQTLRNTSAPGRSRQNNIHRANPLTRQLRMPCGLRSRRSRPKPGFFLSCSFVQLCPGQGLFRTARQRLVYQPLIARGLERRVYFEAPLQPGDGFLGQAAQVGFRLQPKLFVKVRRQILQCNARHLLMAVNLCT